MKPMLCHCAPSPTPTKTLHAAAGSGSSLSMSQRQKQGKARRHPAAPHIKTYVRFSDESMQTVDWAMMTSANLSTQVRTYYL